MWSKQCRFRFIFVKQRRYIKKKRSDLDAVIGTYVFCMNSPITNLMNTIRPLYESKYSLNFRYKQMTIAIRKKQFLIYTSFDFHYQQL